MKIEHKKIFCGQSKILKTIPWPINIYMPNIFHEPHKNPPAPPPTYLMYVSLSLEALEQCYLVKLVSNVLRKISQPRHIRFYE